MGVLEYIIELQNRVANTNIKLTQDQINQLVARYKDDTRPLDTIKSEINELVRTLPRKQETSPIEAKRLEDLPLSYNGITLNNQDIDLMLIASATTPSELKDALSKITNINIDIESAELEGESFSTLQDIAYTAYLDSLTPQNEYLKNKVIALQRKIAYLKDSKVLEEPEEAVLDNILQSSTTKEEIIFKINQTFGQEKAHEIYKTLRDFEPIEKSGIKSMTQEASRNLLEIIRNDYNSITIDEEAKYGKIVLQDGTFDFSHLQKSLDFAKDLGKKVRLNTLLFYMDCPDSLYNLPKTEENRKIVKEKLAAYIDETTRFIKENSYEETVRSIDVFNELLNRFAMDSNKPYDYRGNIEQGLNPSDNIASGWLKHLSLEDLCDCIAIARKNLPNTDFMYNDDNLVDSRKIAPTAKLLAAIRAYEESHNIKLIDSIGTQMHIDNSTSTETIKEMLIELSKFNLPIEITEFDMAMNHKTNDLTAEEIEKYRSKKIAEIVSTIEELKEKCNIRGFTIWSKTDKQNFRVKLANIERIATGLEPIETLHGGYYTDQMTTKSASVENKTQSFNYHTHTKRCGHAGLDSDESYIEAARLSGITTIGFTDHVPFTELEYPNIDQRMDLDQVDEYIKSINNLKEQNKDMTILSGFEAEYDPAKEAFLGELRSKVDYMILGQHYVPDGLRKAKEKDNPNYPLQYANTVCDAIDSGLFDIVAHPDIFYAAREKLETEEEKLEFDKNAEIASRQICEKAKEANIPLELNLASSDNPNKNYPHPTFWNIAALTGVLVLYGVDAHYPGQLLRMEESISNLEKKIDTKALTFVSPDYNPKIARKTNSYLNSNLERGQKEAVTYETYLIGQLVDESLRKKDEGIPLAEQIETAEKMLTQVDKRFEVEAVKHGESL